MATAGDITISTVYETRPTKVLRCGGCGAWAFTITIGATAQIVRSDTRDQARERRRTALKAARLLDRRRKALELRDAVLQRGRA